MMRPLQLELLLLLRQRAVGIGVAILVAAGAVALVHGHRVIARQRAAIAASPAIQAQEHRRILAPLAPEASGSDQLYYLPFHTVREPSPWAPIAIGQRDVHAFNLKVRMLALQGQLYDADLGNPLLATLGNFDLAFVLVVLAPLVLIALTFNVHSLEVEQGTWALVRSLPVRVVTIFARKVLLRAVAVLLPLCLLLLVGAPALGIPLDATWWRVTGSVALYLGTWLVAVAVVVALRRSSEFNLLVLLGVWITWTALGPAAVNVMAAVRHPVPEALELTVLQRQGYHAAWDEPLPVVMEAFYARYPEWRSTPVPRDRYSSAWYYAMQQRGDDAARDAARRYRASLDARDAWVARASWLFPPAAFQRILTRTARTDLAAYHGYLDSVAEYHESLKRHFFPLVFHDRPASRVDWARAPRHRHAD